MQPRYSSLLESWQTSSVASTADKLKSIEPGHYKGVGSIKISLNTGQRVWSLASDNSTHPQCDRTLPDFVNRWHDQIRNKLLECRAITEAAENKQVRLASVSSIVLLSHLTIYAIVAMTFLYTLAVAVHFPSIIILGKAMPHSHSHLPVKTWASRCDINLHLALWCTDAHTHYFWRSSDVKHVQMYTRPSRFSACNIKKLIGPGDEAGNVLLSWLCSIVQHLSGLYMCDVLVYMVSWHGVFQQV